MFTLLLLAGCDLFFGEPLCSEDWKPGYLDTDGDGFGAGDTGLHCPDLPEFTERGGDCDEKDSATYPDAPGTCAEGIVRACPEYDWSNAADAVWLYVDLDGDGFGYDTRKGCAFEPGLVAEGGDCDDASTVVHPDGEEGCDGIDNDCDGKIDDDDESLVTDSLWFMDLDGDDFGDAEAVFYACTGGAHGVANDDDCDDTDSERSPAALEVCNGVDDDCDGSVDVAATDAPVWFMDADGDGYGDDSSAVASCAGPARHVEAGGDCNDADGSISPAGQERCGGSDEDCDGLVDDDDGDVEGRVTWFADDDGDGAGGTRTVSRCVQPAGYTSGSTDCDDADGAVFPGATEVCDSVDNDCDALVDDADPGVSGAYARYVDGDGDGYGAGAAYLACDSSSGSATDSDCDDAAPAAHPGAAETCDGIDNDCDGDTDADDAGAIGLVTVFADADGDGHGDAAVSSLACEAGAGQSASADDCDDGAADVFPSATETCDDGVDQDCNGSIDDGCTDVDGDGFADGSVDKLVADGSSLCWHHDLIGWSGTAYTVGYGFGGGADWTTLAYPSSTVGDFQCFDFSTAPEGLFRVNLWSGSGSGSYTSWAFLELYCGSYADPLCYERTDGLAACFISSGGTLSAASTTLCDAT